MQLQVMTITVFSVLQWWDRGSGGSHDGSYWAANLSTVPFGFFPLGSMGTRGYDGKTIPGTKFYAVRPGSDPQAVSLPVDYSLIWADRGSGADLDGSMWRPICRGGYVSLGDVAQRGYDKPPTSQVVCVKKEYTVPGRVGEFVWNDRRTGSDADFGSWLVADDIDPKGGLPAGTFFGRDSHAPPPNNNGLFVLNLANLQFV